MRGWRFIDPRAYVDVKNAKGTDAGKKTPLVFTPSSSSSFFRIWLDERNKWIFLIHFLREERKGTKRDLW